MSKIENKQSVNGILLLNKPQGLSSNAVLQQVKRLFQAKKAGHTGSLDPLATGMLPICFGEATKFCQYLLDADKCYEASGLLGIKTNTADACGEVTQEISNFVLTESQLLATLEQFRGNIQQIPSMFSALKHKGTPLYKYAREGVDVARAAREIIIHQLNLTGFSNKEFDIKVSCSKGTYIRNLVEDIGDRLGVGAHVTRLHRVHTAGFAEEPMYSIDDLQNKTAAQRLACLLPMERAVSYLPALALNAEEIIALRQGKVLINKIIPNFTSGCVRLHDEWEHFIGLGELQLSGVLTVKRLLTSEAVS
ncbi:tRNA pseudouridine(55) synthase TruB [Legionella tunisiensis]|uniref:tRNA pseudouridine(55) synthase TruB n=1 Tax=Legionella tunisiensis TaxID=1034944 RepID=UPI0002F659ED|nr:tRNA pseudouridine(55) synthase TruB [Legionella tunisiensis]